jgi:hypothetical protein
VLPTNKKSQVSSILVFVPLCAALAALAAYNTYVIPVNQKQDRVYLEAKRPIHALPKIRPW